MPASASAGGVTNSATRRLEIIDPLHGDWSAASGYRLGLPPGGGAGSALFVANDHMAIGVLSALRERAYPRTGGREHRRLRRRPRSRLPRHPPPTTVRQDFASLGELIMQKVLVAVEEPETATEDSALPTHLIGGSRRDLAPGTALIPSAPPTHSGRANGPVGGGRVRHRADDAELASTDARRRRRCLETGRWRIRPRGRQGHRDRTHPDFELHDGPGVNPANVGRKIPRGAILRTIAANICGSDQHMVRGRTTAPEGLVLGHEITGEVVEVGPDVEFIKVGDIVSASFNIACGRCRNCKEGKTGIC